MKLWIFLQSFDSSGKIKLDSGTIRHGAEDVPGDPKSRDSYQYQTEPPPRNP